MLSPDSGSNAAFAGGTLSCSRNEDPPGVAGEVAGVDQTPRWFLVAWIVKNRRFARDYEQLTTVAKPENKPLSRGGIVNPD